MKVSEAWLREWVNPSIARDELAAQLTMAGLEVDAISPVAAAFNHVVVARVVSTRPHPQADKLTLCDIDAGTGTMLKVVCGASNVRAGLTVALACVGAHLPGDLVIKDSLLRGELSQGMLCSSAELGMEASSDGIMELPDDAILGTDLREYLSLNDHVFDLDLTPNRADCFSVLGVARDVAALNQLPLKAIPSSVIKPSSDARLPIQIKAISACPQYAGRIIENINIDAATPLWMKERLRRAGIRAVHPVVDVTNYVMLELGQPMHAFDLNQMNERIDVRFAQADEPLVLLDGQEVLLNENILVVADAERPLAIAGVMGGLSSAVNATTTNIFLESAYFNPLVIAGVARSYGLSSDSAQRFERGVDFAIQCVALERATHLLSEIVGGVVGPVVMMSEASGLPSKVCIAFNPSKVKQLTGLDIPADEMADMLSRLGLSVEKSPGLWEVHVPSYRVDLTLDVDLVEEIIRLYGYDNIKASSEIAVMRAGFVNPVEQLSMRVSDFLMSHGYRETISYSFVDPNLQVELYPEHAAMQLLNPISSELSHMRVGMWPGLLASMIHNMHRQQTSIQFFETGVVFDVNEGVLKERASIAGLLTGDRGHLNWSESAGQFDFYDMKGSLEAMFSGLKLTQVDFVAAAHPALHPGQSAQILIAGRHAGWVGVLHPRLLDALDLVSEVILFELSLSELSHDATIKFQSISKYPKIRRDLSLLVDVNVHASQIEALVRSVVTGGRLKAFDVFDVYMGQPIPIGKKSLSISLTLQDDQRTLVDSEINELMNMILQALHEGFNILLREL